ncbi:MAG TPA: sialidase family protein [Vicinamibacteria bacterium]|nr:sialidase family protein [Vicinamibacteria bacterium]
MMMGTNAPGGAPSRPPLLLALILFSFGAAILRNPGLPPAPFRASSPVERGPDEPRFDSAFVSARNNTQAHAASLVELKDGRVRAFWYAGSREGAEDVEIRSAVFDPHRGGWSGETTVASRESTQASVRRLVKKVGNPTAGRAADGRLWLFYVTVSVGGWAGSSITAMTSSDEGEAWSAPRRLITSPFVNVSTLVRGAPFLYADGTMGLPVYHEFIGQFAELLRLDGAGRVIDKQRLSPSGFGLQPVVLVRGPSEAVALMRYAGPERHPRVVRCVTRDAGQHWTRPTWSTLSNPDAALSGVVLPDGRLLVALNNIEVDRDALSLVISGDGGESWETVHQLEDQLARRERPPDEGRYLRIIERLARASDSALADPSAYGPAVKRAMRWGDRYHFEFSYPSLIQTRDGDFHLVYAWNRTLIKHVRFNRAWLDQQLSGASHAEPH